MQNTFATARSEIAFLNWLAEKSSIERNAVRRVEALCQSTLAASCRVILELGLLPEDALADKLASFLGFQRVTGEELGEDIPDITNISLDYLAGAGLLPLPAPSGHLILATADPFDDERARAAAYFSGLDLELRITTPSLIERRFADLRTAALSDDVEAMDTTPSHAESDAEKLKDLASEAPIIRLLNRLVASAVEQNASDIHLEPVDQRLIVRFRVDGVLRVVESMELQMHLALVSRIKILARLNIAEQRLPQDGRIRLAVRGKNIDLRIATSPTVGGESVVMRILDSLQVKLDLSALGFLQQDQQKVQSVLRSRDGIVLVTGPTGSGKTTTLYAALTLLNSPETKIFTVEDPVEYQIAGISQIPVRENIGLDFSAILRSVLRQDPDVIMIGEIRDGETAKVAVQASLTGHLVLTTVHTNSAVAAITRLRDLGIENYLLASSVRAIIAQRLVRKLCPCCRKPETALPNCASCKGSGYNGRTTIYELLELSPALQTAIASGTNDLDLLSLARSDGFLTLVENSNELVAGGVTTRAEIARVLTTTAS